MKTKIRVRQNGGSKPGLNQAPAKTKSASVPKGAASNPTKKTVGVVLGALGGAPRRVMLEGLDDCDARLLNRDRDITSLGRVLGLDAREIRGMDLILQWEQYSPQEFCRCAVRAFLESSYDDMRMFARGDCADLRERAWARKFFRRLAPLFAKGGAR